MTILGRHVGHRLTARDERTLRCIDCAHTLVVPASNTAAAPAVLDHPRQAEDRCQLHPTEWVHACRPCASERKAATGPRPEPAHNPPTVPEWQQLRQRFPRARA